MTAFALPVTLLITFNVFNFFTNPLFLIGDSGGGWTTPVIQTFNSDGTVSFQVNSLWLHRANIHQPSVTLKGSYAGNIEGEGIFVISDAESWATWVNFNNNHLIPKLNTIMKDSGFIGPFFNYDLVTSKPDLYSNVTGAELGAKFLFSTDEVYRLGILIQATSWASQGPPEASPDLVPTASQLLLDWKNRLFNEWRQLAVVKKNLQNADS